MAAGSSVTLEHFTALVNAHDLTYDYSDDGRAWRLGREQYDRIRKAAEQLPREEVVRIWNAAVDRKMREGFREPFYWR